MTDSVHYRPNPPGYARDRPPMSRLVGYVRYGPAGADMSPGRQAAAALTAIGAYQLFQLGFIFVFTGFEGDMEKNAPRTVEI